MAHITGETKHSTAFGKVVKKVIEFAKVGKKRSTKLSNKLKKVNKIFL